MTKAKLKPYTEKQLVAALRRVEARWPDNYTLFSWSGTLCLLRTADIPEKEFVGSYHDAEVCDFPGITNDGGDPS